MKNLLCTIWLVWKAILFRMKLLIICLMLIVGCSQNNINKVISKPESRIIDYRDRWKALAPFIKIHFDTDKSVEWIAADLSLAAYNLGIE